MIKKEKQSIAIWIAILSCCFILNAACQNKGVSTGLDENDENKESFEAIVPNVKLQVSYNEKTMSFSPLWPDDIVASKSKLNSDSEFLVGYDNTFETVAFNEEGYMFLESIYIEGDSEMHMPEDLYNEIKHKMPAPGSDHDPIVGHRMGNGVLTYYTKSGAEADQIPIDMERIRIEPELLEQILSSESDTSTSSKVARNLEILKNQNVLFKEVGNTHVLLSEQQIDDASSENLEYQELIDLRIGRPIRIAVKNSQGNYESFTQLGYKMFNNYPVVENTEHLQFGFRNGEWTQLRRTVTNRSNITVNIIND